MLDRRIGVGSVVKVSGELFGFEGIVLSMSLCKKKSDEICVWRNVISSREAIGSNACWVKKQSLKWTFIRQLSVEECLTHEAKCVRLLARKVALAT